MPGTKLGGQKARQKNIELYGEDYYKKIRQKRRSYDGSGFASEKVDQYGRTGRERASEVGRLGGLKRKVKKG